MTEKIQGIPLIPDGTEQYLNERQLLDYEDHRRDFLDWCLREGKNPTEMRGYSDRTVKIRSYRINTFYKWLWNEQGYTTSPTVDDADSYMRHIAIECDSADTKANIQKAIKMLYKYLHHTRGIEEWDPELTFRNNTSTTTSQDYVTREERIALREAALEYGSVKNYNSCTPEERDRIKGYLARRYDTPKDEITRQHWRRTNGWKIPSLVMASLDAGLRPIEIERATVSWVDYQNEVLRIPREDDSKGHENTWVVSLQSRTANALERWLSLRESLPKYDDRDALWLTNKGNVYGTSSLNYILGKLCEIADIDTTHRDVTWYSLRRGMITGMIDVADLSDAQSQARHIDPKTTMRYDQTPPGRRRDALDELG